VRDARYGRAEDPAGKRWHRKAHDRTFGHTGHVIFGDGNHQLMASHRFKVNDGRRSTRTAGRADQRAGMDIAGRNLTTKRSGDAEISL